MATLAARRPMAADHRFFLVMAFVMALLNVAGFSVQLAMGRSSFGAPLLVHAHALTFFGWVAIYLTQNALAASESIALHRRLGWIGAAWVVPMVLLGTAATVAMAHVPSCTSVVVSGAITGTPRSA